MKDLGESMVIVMAIAGIVAVIAGLGTLLAWPVMWTWNATMPFLFGLKTLTWSKAWCLYFLAGCLVKSTQTNNNKK